MTTTRARKLGITLVTLFALLVMVTGTSLFALEANAAVSVGVTSSQITIGSSPDVAATVTNGHVYKMTLKLNIPVLPKDASLADADSFKLFYVNGNSFFGTSGQTEAVKKDSLSAGESTVNFDFIYSGDGSKDFKLQMVFYVGGTSIDSETRTLTIHVPQAANDPGLPSPGEPSSDPDPIPPVTSTPDPTPSSSDSVIIKGTGFVLKSVDFGASEIQAGSYFELKTVMMATNGTYNVENVSVEVSPSKEFSISAGSSVIYVGTVKPNQNIPVTIPLTASAIVDEGSYQITLKVTGVNANDGTAVAADMIITVPIIQPERFEISNVQVPDFLTANMDDGMGFSSINLVNKGKTVVYNVTVTIEGEGITTDMGNQFIGNINPGSQSGADFNIMASMPGTIDARVVVTYENAKGEEKQLFHEFTIDVQDMGGGDWSGGIDPFPIDPEPMPSDGGIPFWVWIIVAVAVCGGVVALVIVMKKRKAKKDAALEDDYDEDL